MRERHSECVRVCVCVCVCVCVSGIDRLLRFDGAQLKHGSDETEREKREGNDLFEVFYIVAR